jgi:hypothetical protein
LARPGFHPKLGPSPIGRFFVDPKRALSLDSRSSPSWRNSRYPPITKLPAPAQRAPPEMPRARQRPWSEITLIRLAVLIAAGVIVVLFATQWDRWVGLAVRQVTDDAYVGGDITPLSAHIERYVRRVPVDDFQRVKKGSWWSRSRMTIIGPEWRRPMRTYRRPNPRRAVLKQKPAANAGNCNAPWRTSTTK